MALSQTKWRRQFLVAVPYCYCGAKGNSFSYWKDEECRNYCKAWVLYISCMKVLFERLRCKCWKHAQNWTVPQSGYDCNVTGLKSQKQRSAETNIFLAQKHCCRVSYVISLRVSWSSWCPEDPELLLRVQKVYLRKMLMKWLMSCFCGWQYLTVLLPCRLFLLQDVD